MTIPLSLLFLALNVADIILTNKILAQGGRERNSFIAKMQDKLGSIWWLSKVVLCGFTLFVAWWLDGFYGIILLIVVNAIYAYVVWNNWKELKRGSDGEQKNI